MTYPFTLTTPYRTRLTLTLEEAIAWAVALGDLDNSTITHVDGRRWHWEIKSGKPHLVETRA